MKRRTILATITIGSALGQQPDVQQPHLQNARMETRAVTGGLETTLRSIVNAQSSPAWVGYAVPIIPGDRQMCCWNDSVRGCFLEPSSNDRTVVVSNNQTVKLEGPTQLVVLYRVENRQVGKVLRRIRLVVQGASRSGGRNPPSPPSRCTLIRPPIRRSKICWP
jgi:hypothetical protein